MARAQVREEFYSVYQRQREVVAAQERISAELEGVGEDMERMQVGGGVGGVGAVGGQLRVKGPLGQRVDEVGRGGLVG